MLYIQELFHLASQSSQIKKNAKFSSDNGLCECVDS